MSLMMVSNDSADAPHQAEVFALLRTQSRLKDHLGQAEDAVERRADLVTHVGQEVPLARLAASAASLA